MIELQDVSNELHEELAKQSERTSRTSMIVRGILVIGGSGAAGISHFAADNPLEPWHLVGIIGSALAIIGMIFVLATEHDASSSLEKARKAVVRAQDATRRVSYLRENIEKRDRASARAFSLLSATQQFRTALDAMLDHKANIAGDEPLVTGAIELISRDLSIAMGFRLEEHWTIALYKTDGPQDPKAAYLRCIAPFRTTKCNVSEARIWPSGKGAAGLALLTGEEYIVVDTLDNNNPASIKTLGNNGKPHDQFLYRSIAAVPIASPSGGMPWGVAVATSNRAGHFSEEQKANVEVVRLLGKMIETILRVSLLRKAATQVDLPAQVITTSKADATADFARQAINSNA